MTPSTDTYFCDRCGRAEYSSVGDPMCTFGSGRSAVVVCVSCYKELEEEEKEREKDFLIQEEE